MKKFFVLLVCICTAGQMYAQGIVGIRGSLDNSLSAIEVRKDATVAFLGGSITEMKGWKDMVEVDLKARFPQTEFHFIEAGIASLGSTPHAFRFEEDVLAKGTPDLLFVEATVNDHTNFFGPQEQVRGMEGIVRHALRANPMMDIVVLEFIYDPFIPVLASGEIPDVILNHERVANHYHLCSINLAKEVSDRMLSGRLTWEEFGGTHPAPAGHRIYADFVDSLIVASLRPEYVAAPHAMPEPIDSFCYDNAFQANAGTATGLKGFRLVDSWRPGDDVEKRWQFVDIPALVTDNGGSLKFEFEGKTVGIYCVCGPNAGVLKYKVDRGEWKTLDTHTIWSDIVHLPWVYVLASDMDSAKHTLKLKVLKGERSGCYIKSFVVN